MAADHQCSADQGLRTAPLKNILAYLLYFPRKRNVKLTRLSPEASVKILLREYHIMSSNNA